MTCAKCPIAELEKLLSDKPVREEPYRVKGTTIDVGGRDVKYRTDAAIQLYQRVYGCPTESEALHMMLNDLGRLWVARAKEAPEMIEAVNAIKRVFAL